MVLERSVSLHQAEHRIDQWLASSGLKADIRVHGAPLSSTVATLAGESRWSGDRIGCGKGYPDEARIGAKFEAYEHLVGSQALRDASLLAGSRKTLAQPALQGLLPLRLLGVGNGKKIGVIDFSGDEQSLPPLQYPAFLVDYAYATRPLSGDTCDYARARRYSCGTGLAAGVDALESLVHAVSEVIERHAVGTFIARHYFRGKGATDAPHALDRASLPAQVQALLGEAEAELDAAIVLDQAASDIDCPVVIARCTERTIAGLHVMGSGASLHGAHAVTRAIKELVQQYKVAEGEEEGLAHWTRCRRRLAPWPRLQGCLQLRPAKVVEPYLDFTTIAGQLQPLSLGEHLQTLQRRCRDAGRPVWTRVLRSEPAGVVLGCAVMPRMERFAIAALGGVVVPCYG